jgi:heme A synthase
LVLLEYVADDASSARGLWVGGHLVNTFFLVGSLALTAWWASGGRPFRMRVDDLASGLLAAAILGMLLLGVSGAITALGDTLFPAATFEQGKAMTFADDAHIFVRLRIWHPTMALVVSAIITAAAYAATRSRQQPTVIRWAIAAIALVALELSLGLVNMWLLAPVPLQLAHLLLSDLLWIAVVLLTASTLAIPATQRQ